MLPKILPNQYIAIRTPNDQVVVEQVVPNNVINLRKYGTFRSNSLIGRPYHLTWDILDKSERESNGGRDLELVSTAELHAETNLEEAEPDLDDEAAEALEVEPNEFGLLTDGKSNVNTLDRSDTQTLSADDIELLKSSSGLKPSDLIAKIMANNKQLDQKTAFSLAKYTLRKQKKYLKRFTVLPLDIATLCDWQLEDKDASKILEIRGETLALIGSYANAHAGPQSSTKEDGVPDDGSEKMCRYLVVDDTGGLVTGMLAERMGLLHFYPPPQAKLTENSHRAEKRAVTNGVQNSVQPSENAMSDQPNSTSTDQARLRPRLHEPKYATSNTLTLIHSNQQPNLSLLKYFGFDHTQTPSPTTSPEQIHPLHTHLNTLSWLQLLKPKLDPSYNTVPPDLTLEEFQKLKSNARSNHHRKRRRHLRIREIVTTVRTGGYDSLIVASYMDPISICKHLVPLLRGGAQIVIYSPHIEPLMPLCDAYSTGRRAAFIAWREHQTQNQHQTNQDVRQALDQESRYKHEIDLGDDSITIQQEDAIDSPPTKKPKLDTSSETPNPTTTPRISRPPAHVETPDFPLNPTQTLGLTIHTTRLRRYQVLPGRTHPLMTGRGGSEGYIAVGSKVIPLEGTRVVARGRAPRRARKPDKNDEENGGEESDGS